MEFKTDKPTTPVIRNAYIDLTDIIKSTKAPDLIISKSQDVSMQKYHSSFRIEPPKKCNSAIDGDPKGTKLRYMLVNTLIKNSSFDEVVTQTGT